ncbi:peptidoglycan DD-metalloendopeptidase family protein [Sulfurospirillum arcachonense]|uniref:peptidoglycan DD-metalloendopeptidase family protein n=1 Tax=Sulfurospirillum arcachonense TaxID=57666 RepID=UPI000469BE1E|nr:peptidoglycan DD-metalloendopeptidase family protein [Sulfurospirillum arcachonense]
MIRTLFLLLLCTFALEAATLEVKKWSKGETFLTFLEKNKLPLKIYYDLAREEQELATEIMSNVDYQILKNDNDEIEQVMIPIGEELQLHLIKEKNGYELTTTPISFQEEKLAVTVEIKRSPYEDIIDETNNYLLAHEFIQAFKSSVNFKLLRKGDKVVIFYTKRTRLGRQFGAPKIEAAMVEVRGRKNYVFSYNKGRYYDANGKEVEGFFLSKPVNYRRISSRFTYKRWHPVLKRYRAHLGIDYAANRGTPIRAAGNGKLTYVGRKGGYGKTIMIRHQNGYKTLYAHMKGYRKGMRRGKWVKKGQVIGYVGSTGISTGPHLHFGLYKNNRAINPNSVVKITKSKLTGKKRKEFFAYIKQYKKDIEVALNDYSNPSKEKDFDYIVSLDKIAEQPN